LGKRHGGIPTNSCPSSSSSTCTSLHCRRRYRRRRRRRRRAGFFNKRSLLGAKDAFVPAFCARPEPRGYCCCCCCLLQLRPLFSLSLPLSLSLSLFLTPLTRSFLYLSKRTNASQFSSERREDRSGCSSFVRSAARSLVQRALGCYDVDDHVNEPWRETEKEEQQ
jgi:hypothetical protein